MDVIENADVLVVGAGIGGLTAALALHEVGIEPVVVERVREVRPLGVGINLQPHAVGELAALGLVDELDDIAVATAEHVYTDERGNRVFSDPRGRAAGQEWPQYSVHRGELQMMLLRAARERLGPDAVRTASPVRGLRDTAGGVEVRLGDDAASRTVTANAVVGADGLHSTVRALLHPEQPAPRWSGVQMWRGSTVAPPFLTGRSMVIASSAAGVQLVAYPLSQTSDPGADVVVNWVCLVPVGEPGPLEAGVSWTRPGRIEDVWPHYRDWDLGCVDLAALLAAAPEILEYPMVDREPLEAWGRGRVTLLGDAAHPVYPTGANGGSQAIVDARVLARELAGADDRATGLSRYEDSRRSATADLVHATREMDRAGRAGPGTGSVASITEDYRRVAEKASTPRPAPITHARRQS